MKGRVHFYEGYSIEQVVMPARVMHALGAQILFLTNASGGINPAYHPGSLVMLRDHISLFVPNPMIGPNDDEEGLRFFDMTKTYDEELREVIRNAAQAENIPLEEGVYTQCTGPSFESPAEIKMLGLLGSDLVGMSTVVEAITARHMDMRVCGISLVTNLAAGISTELLSHEDVQKAAAEAEPLFTRLVTASIHAMGDIV